MSKLEEIKKRFYVSGADCKCHSMKTCPGKAMEYWDHYDSDVSWLIDKLESLEKENKDLRRRSGDRNISTLTDADFGGHFG